jgi:glycosyltransferase involved in cell wall biosynthesis
VPFVLWLQDIYSAAMGTAVRERLGRVGTVPARLFTAADRSALRDAAAVVAISEDVLPFVAEAQVPDERVTVIENWAPLDEVDPVARDNPWSRDHGLAAVDVALYSGTLGLKHDPSLLADLARAAERRGHTSVVVISEGLGADWLRDEQAREGLPALSVLPYQDHAQLAAVLASADVLVAVLEPDAGAYSVPSKILNYHAAGRPIVATLPPENLAARTIEAAGSGVVVRPGDRDGFVDAVIGLLDDPERRRRLGAAARDHAVAAFAIGPIADRFEAVMDTALRTAGERAR